MDNCFYIFVIVLLSPLYLIFDVYLAIYYEKWKNVQVQKSIAYCSSM